MYIPTTFMSSQGSCFSVTATSITGSGLITTGSFFSGGVVWDYYQFEMTDRDNYDLTPFTASLNVFSGSTSQAKLLIVGAGGSGGFGSGSGTTGQQNFAAGGGGGGGVVYYDQFPLSSGSYEIGVANATAHPPVSTVGKTGGNSYFKNKNITYAPFTSSLLIAYGGGGGGWGRLNSFPNTCILFTGEQSSTTGGLGLYNGQCGTPLSPPDTIYSNLGGIARGPQGYKGGTIESSSGTGFRASGGGGAKSVAPVLTTNQQNFGTITSNGGDGFDFNLTGTIIGVSPGGGAQAGGVTVQTSIVGNCTNSGSAYGRGGQGERDGAPAGTINRGFAGLVIVAIPKCNTDLKQCTEYRISGGATGGTITYIPCGTDDITSASIDFGFTGSICTYKVGPYPSSTGTVTLTPTGSCNTFIPLQPTVTCTGGQVKTPVYLWDYTLTGTCYPTPSSCQRYFYGTRTANYVDANGVSQSVNVSPFFASTPTVTGQLCARDFPIPTINGSQLPTGSKTNLICGYYCSGSI